MVWESGGVAEGEELPRCQAERFNCDAKYYSQVSGPVFFRLSKAK